jgi:hypothetical protein
LPAEVCPVFQKGKSDESLLGPTSVPLTDNLDMLKKKQETEDRIQNAFFNFTQIQPYPIQR